MIISLFEPDIPQNAGSMVRLCACLDVALHIIEPCGFPLDHRRLKRVAMDYYDLASITRHDSWRAFLDWRQTHASRRLVLLSTHAKARHTDFAFRADDILLFGRESSGVPLRNGARSLNLVQAASMIAGEALRQVGGYGGMGA